MAIYGRINDVSPLKGFNGNEISYQSIQLPSWLEEKDKKNFLRFYYMLRYGVEIGDNNILATSVYDEGKSKNIILYSGLRSENVSNSIHVESNNTPLVPAIRTSNNSIVNTNRASYNYGVQLSISDANELNGTNARVHLDILINGFNSILGYANSLGFNIKFILSINDNNYGDLYASTQYNIMSSSRVIDTGKHNLESETHTIKFNYIKVLLIGNDGITAREIACVSSFENNEPFMYRDIRNGPWNGSWLWSSDSHSEDETRNLIFSNADFNWDF